MAPHDMNLPSRISLMMAVTVLAFLVTLVWSINSLRLAMDARAREDSVRLVASEIAALRTANEVVNADYNQWDEAFLRISDRDLRWIGANYSFGVALETSFDRLAIFDGPYGSPISWGSGAGYDPSGNHVSPAAIAAARDWLQTYAAGDRTRIISFNALENGVPVIYSASFIIPHTDAVAMPEAVDVLPASIMGRTLSDERLHHVSEVLGVTDVGFSLAAVADRPHLALPDIAGEALGYLYWSAPRPGTDLVRALMPMLSMVVLACLGLAGVIIYWARRTAVTLVRQKAQAATQARTDSLTGLPNRLAFTELVQGADAVQAGSLAVLFIDIDDFKRINDEVGHAGGDEVVLELARRLATLQENGLFLARVGGDEFVAVCTDSGNCATGGTGLAQSIAALMTPPFQTRRTRFHVTVSQGLAVRDADTTDPGELVRRANVAMFHAKRAGRGHWRAYDDQMALASQEDRVIEDALRRDIAAQSDFTMRYQPLVCANTGRILRAEALARWQPADLGPVTPDRFIEVAEKSGLIVPLGRLLLELICQDLARAPDMRVSVNISPIQLQSANFLDDLRGLIAQYNIAPDRIEIELTEGVIVDNPDAAALRLDTIRDLGFGTALDDFGTGFSSIGYLRKMQFDTLKIDREFLDAGGGAALIQSMIQLGHALGQSVVCEGVETDDHVQQLTRMGCDVFQGYRYGEPMPQEALVALIAGQGDRGATGNGAARHTAA